MADALSSSEIASLDRSVDRGGEGSAEATVLHAEQNEIEESGLYQNNRKRSYQNRNLTAAAAQKRLLKPS